MGVGGIGHLGSPLRRLTKTRGESARRKAAFAPVFLSLRRHDPDQVRRVAAPGILTDERPLSPLPGPPLDAAIIRRCGARRQGRAFTEAQRKGSERPSMWCSPSVTTKTRVEPGSIPSGTRQLGGKHAGGGTAPAAEDLIGGAGRAGADRDRAVLRQSRSGDLDRGPGRAALRRDRDARWGGSVGQPYLLSEPVEPRLQVRVLVEQVLNRGADLVGELADRRCWHRGRGC